MDPDDLLMISEGLARGALGSGRGRPRQAELRRAVSTAYYAMFHALALCGANTLAGASREIRSLPAWRQIYRALEHGHARNQCNNRAVVNRFPPEIRDFAELFGEMQLYRQSADYDPDASFSRSHVINLIGETARVVNRFNISGTRYRREFAVFVLFRLRNS